MCVSLAVSVTVVVLALLQSLMACILRDTMVSQCEQGNVGWPSTRWRGGWWGWGSRPGLHAVRHHGRADGQTATAGLWPQLSAQDEHQTYLTVSHAQQDEHKTYLIQSQYHKLSKMNINPITWHHMYSKLNIDPILRYHMQWCTADEHQVFKPISWYRIHNTERWTSNLSHSVTCTARWTSSLSHSITCTARWTSGLSHTHSITCTARWTLSLSHGITCTARWTLTLSHGISCTDQN